VIVSRIATTANPLPCPLSLNTVAPVFCWDHVSHKAFSLLLSYPSRFEANEGQNWR
jgi:hypothetical protein